MPNVLRLLTLLAVALVASPAPARANPVLERLQFFCGALGSPGHDGHGVPVAIARQQLAGPYAVSLWANPDVGDGKLYVVVVPRDGVPFIAPNAVRITLRPASGADLVQRYYALAEPVKRGARFVAPVALTHADTWEVDLLIDGASGRGELHASFDATTPGAPGMATVLWYIAPFFLVARLWGPRRRVQLPSPAQRPAPLPSL